MRLARGEPAAPPPPDHAAARRSAEELDRRLVALRGKLEDGARRAHAVIDEALAAAITRLREKRENPRFP